jgi:hypothetical protein
MDSYGTPLDAVSTDIRKVGGLDAYLGMVRHGRDGKKYVLVQSNASIGASTSRIILAYDGGEAFKVTQAAANARCNGVPATNNAISGGDYMWMQVYGRCDNVISTGTKGSYIGSAGSGVGATLALDTGIDEGGADTLTFAGYVGWGIEDSASSMQSVFIEPGFHLI